MNHAISHVIFCYGLLLADAVMADRCPHARYIGRARILDYRYGINRFGVATLVPCPDALTYGVLWELFPDDLIACDYFEGVHFGTYHRRKVLAIDEKDRGWKAMAYVARNRAPGLPRPGYQEIVVQSASRHAFPEAYVRELIKWLH